MKKLLLSVMAFALMYSVNAQIDTPPPSPSAKIEQKVGLTDVVLEYSRPSMRGRTIFGDLVPYDKLWRTGANKNTMITFSDEVKIAGKTLKAGSYAIFTKPGKTSWDVIFYSDTNNWGTPQEWDDSKVAVKATAQIYEMPMKVETFTMTFDDLSSGSAVLGMLWENVYVGVPFEVPTDKTVTASINKVMNGPSANDYYAAAVYYSREGKDINQAKEWIDKAMSMIEKPAFWHFRQQSLIYAKAGDKKAAIATAKKSLAGAEEAGNADYIKMNKDSLKEWGAL
ncbi:DUF2911 domain-containing protein [Snuella sedimenti]|uniref:DUF2911 domain-containing protein n=1 Tax=Snuella sedimenti TaxID=2798802 RepID=A0A8J7J055_9FLAO|nr:DUF2911 domain-containing protein [Snuella sedimenti]MBJ6367072.1 DUF2911 domain-containing protein [Snuella sedimenti]